MSNLNRHAEGDCRAVEPAGDAVSMIIEPRERDLGGFSVRRVLPFARRRQVGPFVFFDHMGPAELAPGEGIDVRPHPHIGLATVTWLFEGEMVHRDSLGNEIAIRPGAVNLMVAGRGIVHSERTGADVRARGHRLHALQLWVALPGDLEECEPAFYHTPADNIPRVERDGAEIRVIMGEAFGVRSPVNTLSPAVYTEVSLEPGGRLALPAGAGELAVYVVSGRLGIAGRAIEAHSMAVLEPSAGLEVDSDQATRFVIVGGEPLGERYIDWNFVSSSRERIARAREDWKAGRFDRVPGDDEFIPLPEP